ncbi:hypothetical protein Cgig2_020821 [Carnegiea gigantea]|uniref:Uncharacterized protein n=1 Tax=Carnegiea gigantea TaxID=171969 RepID=A0A9Q1KI42_9CARY|nr:hypothetical protein Cgig2_020821 [Carnegiea gigantea]
MKGLEADMISLKRHPLQILGWGGRIACTSSTRSASYSKINGQATPQDCCQAGSLLIKRLVWRIRSRLKQYYLRRMKGGIKITGHGLGYRGGAVVSLNIGLSSASCELTQVSWSKDLGDLCPTTIEGTAWGWFHRSTATSYSCQWKDNKLVPVGPDSAWLAEISIGSSPLVSWRAVQLCRARGGTVIRSFELRSSQMITYEFDPLCVTFVFKSGPYYAITSFYSKPGDQVNMDALPAFADPDKHLSVKCKPIEMDSAIELCNLQEKQLTMRGMREAGFTEQRLPPAPASGKDNGLVPPGLISTWVAEIC